MSIQPARGTLSSPPACRDYHSLHELSTRWMDSSGSTRDAKLDAVARQRASAVQQALPSPAARRQLQEPGRLPPRWLDSLANTTTRTRPKAVHVQTACVCSPVRADDGPVPAGNYHSLHELLPRWLDSLANTRDGDITPHVIVVALGHRALEACQQHAYSHHCVLQHNWPGPDQQYTFATPW